MIHVIREEGLPRCEQKCAHRETALRLARVRNRINCTAWRGFCINQPYAPNCSLYVRGVGAYVRAIVRTNLGEPFFFSLLCLGTAPFQEAHANAHVSHRATARRRERFCVMRSAAQHCFL